MDFIQSIVLGIVEGLTEFLPISSTAHLIIAARLLAIGQTEFAKSFEIIIQLGAILAVMVLYWQKFLKDLDYLKKIIVAFLPTAVVGFIFYQIIKNFLMESLSVIALALLLGGIIIIIFEAGKSKRTADNGSDLITYKKAFLIGLCQSVAVIPGVSRAAATIIGGLSLKLSRRAIVEFSFLLAVPTMLAATGYDLIKTGFNFSGGELEALLVGFLVSFFAALAGVKFFLKFITKYNFFYFGVYRIILGLIILAWLWC
ncbi:MAG: undecaprenyl-diphosphate phosphatase [Patescibacteria group bacterium]|nr:undecaprenyl-diphosphate phosphatase [Patescibacteria group bacterium]MDD5294361.1 undecaprenyl-diphosphate phosphatase [Patescibacteria group bacterium]MDD5554195.1 undecaprenyl-diphosphate phosphatase [Patescibacteria group bacterium]